MLNGPAWENIVPPEFSQDMPDGTSGGTDDSCQYANDGYCDDNTDWCPILGTDCSDCNSCADGREVSSYSEDASEGDGIGRHRRQFFEAYISLVAVLVPTLTYAEVGQAYEKITRVGRNPSVFLQRTPVLTRCVVATDVLA